MSPDDRPRLATSDPDLVAEGQGLGRKYRREEDKLNGIRQEMRDFVAKAREAGWGYDRIAACLGMTKGWAQQVAPDRPASPSRAGREKKKV